MNTTYASKINPQFQNAGVQDVSADLSGVKKGFDTMIKQNENELKALRNIAQDQAQIQFNRGAAELVKQYGDDYEGLNRAMLDLENGIYNEVRPTHPDMAEDLLRQNDLTRMRAVEQARKQNVANQNKKIRLTSSTMLDGVEAAASDDYLIYLGEISTKNPEERKPQNIQPFLDDLKQHNAILERKDADGNPIFTDTQVSSRKGMKGVRMDAAYRFINGMTLEQLENFYNNKFQSEQWAKEAGFNVDDWYKLESKAKSRIKELKSEEGKAIKVRAIQDTADLINNGTDMIAIDRLKKSGLVPEKMIDDVVNASNKKILNEWYDPENNSDPYGTLKLYAQLEELYKSQDDSPEAMVDRIKGFVDIADNTSLHAKELNLPPEKYREYMEDIKSFIKDKEFRDAVVDIDVAGLARDALPDDLSDLWGKDKTFDKYIEQDKIIGEKNDPIERHRAKQDAALYIDREIPNLMTRIRSGNIESAKSLAESMRYNKAKKANSYWIVPETMDKLEEELKAGKKPLYSHNGTVLEYQGTSGDTSLFKTKLF